MVLKHFPLLVHVEYWTFSFSSVAQSCPTLCEPMNCSMPDLPVHHQLPEFTQTMSTESMIPSNHLNLCRPLLLLSSIFPSISSVQFSRSVVSDSLGPHESQHARPPCPSPTPGVHSDSRPSSPWCHPAISSSVVPFSSCSQQQSLFQWVNSSHEVAKVLEPQL